MSWIARAVCVGVLALDSLAWAQNCPLGEYWDVPMAMCMPGAAPIMPISNWEMYDAMISPDHCGASGYMHFGMSMCLPKPQRLGRFSGMVMGDLFLADVEGEGPRGRHAIAAPNWAMFNLGIDLASWNRLELDVMLTAELWTFPQNGYPLLMQIGEANQQGIPFIDAQHPHSSPIMGLTLTDVIALSRTKTRLLRLFFAPRGESTDGPIAFMHRPTGTVNPDAPLSHHIGQDVGHISSTVIGASLIIDHTTIEASAFHGLEPEPTRVDLPIATPDSGALRLVQQFGRWATAAASLAYVTNPEGDPTIPYELRLSASGYLQHDLPANWRAHAALIWGGITNFDHATMLNSITAEVLFANPTNAFWSRIETLQRTPAELAIAASAPNSPQWIGAVTLGYTRAITDLWRFAFSVGGSVTLNVIPDSFVAAYGSAAVFTGKLFLEARLLSMFSAGK